MKPLARYTASDQYQHYLAMSYKKEAVTGLYAKYSVIHGKLELQLTFLKIINYGIHLT